MVAADEFEVGEEGFAGLMPGHKARPWSRRIGLRLDDGQGPQAADQADPSCQGIVAVPAVGGNAYPQKDEDGRPGQSSLVSVPLVHSRYRISYA